MRVEPFEVYKPLNGFVHFTTIRRHFPAQQWKVPIEDFYIKQLFDSNGLIPQLRNQYRIYASRDGKFVATTCVLIVKKHTKNQIKNVHAS